MKVYLDFNDWWIGYYRGPNHHYICPLPTLVFRVKRTYSNEKPLRAMCYFEDLLVANVTARTRVGLFVRMALAARRYR